ncbi:hypothetical protein [Streptomyces flaveolus]|uniref:hypothetical protein n=1 Tax=Streptomyces flaveolus TaxID=67297 RepID=UPI0037FEB214
MQQARVGEVVGVGVEGGGALFGQVLDGPLGGGGGAAPGGCRAGGGQSPGRDGEGVPDLLGFLRAAGVGGGGVGADGGVGLSEVGGALLIEYRGGDAGSVRAGRLVMVVGEVGFENGAQPLREGIAQGDLVQEPVGRVNAGTSAARAWRVCQSSTSSPWDRLGFPAVRGER